jgi:hypothetical protein
MLHCVVFHLVTVVSGNTVGPTFNGEAALVLLDKQTPRRFGKAYHSLSKASLFLLLEP